MDRGDILSLAAIVMLVVVATAVSDWRDTRAFGGEPSTGLRAPYRDLRSRGWPPTLAGPVSVVLWLLSWL